MLGAINCILARTKQRSQVPFCLKSRNSVESIIVCRCIVEQYNVVFLLFLLSFKNDKGEGGRLTFKEHIVCYIKEIGYIF